MSATRLLRLDAVDNARDYGDYATAAGRHVRSGVLFRTAHHARASDADLQRMADWGVGTVVDLRRPSERRHQPSRRPAGFSGQVIEVAHDDGGEAPHLTFLKTTDLTETSGRGFMIGAYRSMPFDPGHLDVFARYFRALGEGQAPVLIHCAAGKDRTGIICALTHTLAGVHRDDIIADFLLTNDPAVFDVHAPLWQEEIAKERGRAPSMETMHVAMGVHESYLDRAFQVIDETYGGVDRYLGDVLGIDAATRAKLEHKLFD